MCLRKSEWFRMTVTGSKCSNKVLLPDQTCFLRSVYRFKKIILPDSRYLDQTLYGLRCNVAVETFLKDNGHLRWNTLKNGKVYLNFYSWHIRSIAISDERSYGRLRSCMFDLGTSKGRKLKILNCNTVQPKPVMKGCMRLGSSSLIAKVCEIEFILSLSEETQELIFILQISRKCFGNHKDHYSLRIKNKNNL